MHTLLLALMAAIPKKAVVVLGQSLALGMVAPAITTSAVGDSCWWSTNAAIQLLDGYYRVTSERTPLQCDVAVEASYETPRVAMAESYRARTGSSLMIMSEAVGSQVYTSLKKGTVPWTTGIYMMESYGARVQFESVVGAVVIHGESDGLAGVTAATYQGYLEEWQRDFEALARRCTETGGGETVPLYVSQLSIFLGTTVNAGGVAAGQRAAARANPGKIVLVGPKYQFTYVAPGDFHVNAAGSRDMALLNGAALAQGPTWQPLDAIGTSLSGSVIRQCYRVPYPPIVLDTVSATNAGNYGFQYSCGSAPPAISSVAVFGQDCIDITLASEPSTACKLDDVVRYAWDATTSMRGNVRDSNPAGHPYYNWLVHLEESVP